MKFFDIRKYDSSAFFSAKRVIDISPEEGIRAKVGNLVLDPDGKPVIESYLFDAERFSKEQAEAWVGKYGNYTLEGLLKLHEDIDVNDRKSKKEVKYYKSKIVKIDKENHIAYAQISTADQDRDKEVLPTDSWKKHRKYYENHPVLVSSHNYFELRSQIGEAVEVDWDTLTFGFKWYVNEGNPEADWGWKLAEKGMAMFSVGFIPHKRLKGDAIPEEYRKGEPSAVLPENELLEVSQVVVGSNRGALQCSIDKPSKDHLQFISDIVTTFKDIPDLEALEKVAPGSKPYPNEHACRLHSPDDYKTCRRDTKKSDGKEYSVLYCQRKDDEKKWEEQAYRYNKDKWTEDQAKKHCDAVGGKFEAAKPEKSKAEYDCECIDCGHTMKSDSHCKDLKCPKCGGQMRRAERPGPGQNSITADSFIIEPLAVKNMKDLTEIVAIWKEGRVLSDKNRGIVKSAIENISKCAEMLTGLLALTNPKDGGDKPKAVSTDPEITDFLNKTKK